LKSKLIESNTGKTYAVIFEEGDEVSSGLLEFAKRNALGASHFTAIGGFREVTLGYYELDKKEYKQIPLKEQVEVLSLVGDIALHKGEPKVHAHVVVGTSEGVARGGHLIKGYVRPTLELVVTESPTHLHRQYDPASGLALIRI
jgi:predicted DNA-binding protein with PD1-like motif